MTSYYSMPSILVICSRSETPPPPPDPQNTGVVRRVLNVVGNGSRCRYPNSICISNALATNDRTLTLLAGSIRDMLMSGTAEAGTETND